MSKVSTDGVSRKLIDHIVGAAELGKPRALLATTFDLSPEFVDIDFLPSMLRLPTFDDRRVRSRVLLEGELASMSSVAMLMEARRYQGRPRSLRVDVRPAIKDGGGVLHAKVVVLVHDDAVRLVVGSANLTTSGYRENREVALALQADRKRPEEAAVIRQALEEMPVLLAPWWSAAARSVHASALEVLGSLKTSEPAEDTAFTWGGGEQPLWRRVVALWPQGEAVQRIRIVSPFWSDENGDGPIARLLGELKARQSLAPGADLLLMTAAQGETTTTYRPVLPPSYGQFDFRSLGVTARAIAARPQVDEEDVGREDALVQRALHAKIVILEGPQTSLAYAGSANFTVPGWGFGKHEAANIEAGVVLRRRGRARAALAGLLPPTVGEAVPLQGAATGKLQTPAPDDETTEFPTFLLAVELRPSSADSELLDLVVDVEVARSPETWSISLDEQQEPLVVGNATQAEHRIGLSTEAVNALLRGRVVYVRWATMASDKPVAYPVNITLAAREKLPFADPEAFPGESQLVAFFQGRIAWEDVFPLPRDEEGEGDGPEALPSAVDTSKILSYQVRSFVEALQGIRDALRDAAVTVTTLRMALLGPVSPLALARQVHLAVARDGRSPTAGAFQLVELLTCFQDASSWDVDARVAEPWKLACQEASLQVSTLLAEVRGRASDLGEGLPFDEYVKAVAVRPALVEVGS